MKKALKVFAILTLIYTAFAFIGSIMYMTEGNPDSPLMLVMALFFMAYGILTLVDLHKRK